ncbi:hypothetical protein [Streptomyces sp. V1I1]|uniref:lipase/acyltransferase domain-containing protein n=1 Tax=Streptomyces sp. V1I1 TaxID=3042272 RepID=UPI002788CAA6|nr:hypothetical protein [Streptomyces sp. V1I1]MDQ0944046.1 hypothetical protein [Streptomyces sp. V1I1]
MPRQPLNDLVVVLPGIMGSRLADADENEVWGLSGAALWRGIRTLGRSIGGLTLPHDLGDDHPGDGVRATGVLSDLHALPGRWALVDGYTGLLDWLERGFTLSRRFPGQPAAVPTNLLPFPYDWRLSCRYNAGLLKATVEEELDRWRASAAARKDARVTFVCHSMGGLIARFYVECLGGHEITRRLITLGTPHRGSLDALEALVNGHSVGPRRLRAALTRFARSLPSLHQLTPDYACLTTGKALLYARELPTALPGVDEKLLHDAGAFHAAIREAAEARTKGAADPAFVPFVGVLQPTATTATRSDDGERLITSTAVGSRTEGGDGTVPRLSAHPPGATAGHTPCERHGSLQVNRGVRDALWNLLAPEPAYHRGPEDEPVRLGVDAPDFVAADGTYELTATVPPDAPGGDELALRATLRPADGGLESRRTLRNHGEGQYSVTFPGPLNPGPYRVTVEAAGRPDSAVTALLLAGDHESDA